MRADKGEPTAHFCTTRVLTTYTQIPRLFYVSISSSELIKRLLGCISPHPSRAASIFEASATRSPCFAGHRVVLPGDPERIRDSHKTTIRRCRLPAFSISCTTVYADKSSTWLTIYATGRRFSNTLPDLRSTTSFGLPTFCLFAGFTMPTQCDLVMLNIADVVRVVLATVLARLFCSRAPRMHSCATRRGGSPNIHRCAVSSCALCLR